MKIKLISLCAVVLFFSCGFTFPSELPTECMVSSSAQSAYLYDALSGRVFYEKNENVPRSIASTTKIVTAITAIEHCEALDEKFEIDSRAVGIEGSSIYLRKGEHLSMRDLLYGLMLRSGNDCACAIAYRVGGSIEEFANMMNALVNKIGVENSHFTNPHGLDDENHFASSKDLAKITGYALLNPVFKEIVSTKNIKVESDDGYRYMTNKNRLLASLEGCVGVKTGYTRKAGRCLVSAVERNGMMLVCVVLNCGPMFEESAAMLNKICDLFKAVEILAPWQYVADIPLNRGEAEFVQVFSKQGFSLPLTQEECDNIHINVEVPQVLDAPVQNEAEVGKVEIYYKNHLIFSEKVYTLREVDSRMLKDKVKQIIDRWGI